MLRFLTVERLFHWSLDWSGYLRFLINLNFWAFFLGFIVFFFVLTLWQQFLLFWWLTQYFGRPCFFKSCSNHLHVYFLFHLGDSHFVVENADLLGLRSFLTLAFFIFSFFAHRLLYFSFYAFDGFLLRLQLPQFELKVRQVNPLSGFLLPSVIHNFEIV